METRRRIGRFELPANAELSGGVPDSVAALSPDGTRLVAAVRLRVSNASVATVVTGWDVKTGKKLSELDAENTQVLAIAAASRNSCVLSTRDSKLWEVNFERGISGKVRGADIQPGGQAARRGGADWKAGMDRPRLRLAGGTLAALVHRPHRPDYSTGVLVERHDPRVRVGGRHRAPLGSQAARGEVAVAARHHLRVRRLLRRPIPEGVKICLGTTRLRVNFGGYGSGSTAFSPDGKTLASGSQDTTVLLWNLSVIGK
jgi:WD40 repeat protein